MKLIMKFGGTSVANGINIKRVSEIVKEHSKDEVAVVVSALRGVTDLLVGIGERVASGVSESYIRRFVGEMKERHIAVAREVVSEDNREVILMEIEKLCTELEKVLIGVSYVGELTPRSSDYILSFGERLSVPLVSGALRSAGIKSNWFSGYEAGIITDSNFGWATPIWSLTKKRVRRILKPLMKESVPVVAGFIAADFRKRITTLSRGGSDFTAAILGSVLGVDEIWIWTDVDGILTTDPKLVHDAKIIKELSYIEAMELAYFGAKILHPKTIEPAMERRIPVRVRNTFNPSNSGTLIVREEAKSKETVKAISVMKNAVLLTISGVGMIGVPGVAARVFGALAMNRVNILMISQGSSEVNISLVISRDDLQNAREALKKEFSGKNIVKEIHYEKDVSIIAVVGAGMRGTRGVASRVFGAVARAGVNILMIAQGSSEVNISFIVSNKDAKKAAEALHREFIA